MSKKKQFKERINVIIDKSLGKNTYCGSLVNYFGSISANTIEDLKEESKDLLKTHIELTQELVDQKDPFEIKMFDDMNEWLFADSNITH